MTRTITDIDPVHRSLLEWYTGQGYSAPKCAEDILNVINGVQYTDKRRIKTYDWDAHDRDRLKTEHARRQRENNLAQVPAGHVRLCDVARRLGISDAQLNGLLRERKPPVSVVGTKHKRYLTDADVYTLEVWFNERYELA